MFGGSAGAARESSTAGWGLASQASLEEYAANGSFTDGQAPGHFQVAHALPEPTLDEDLLARTELGRAAGGCVGLQASAAVLRVACFPTALGSHGMSKGIGNLDLGRQLTLT